MVSLSNHGQWSRFGRWADKSARPEPVEGRAVGCSWFDRLTTSVGTDIGAQQTRLLPNHAFSAVPVLREGKKDLFEIVTGDGRASARRRQRRKLMDPAFPARTATAQ